MKQGPTGKSSVNAWEQTHFRQLSSPRQSGMQVLFQRLLGGWYHLSSPPEPPFTATVAQRERARRGRAASIILLAAQLFCIIDVIIGFSSHNLVLAGAFAFLGVVNFILIFVNRRGHLLLVSMVFIVLAHFAGYQIFFTPGGLSLTDLPRLDMLALEILLIITFSPPLGAIVIAFLNCMFIWVLLTFAPRAPDLAAAFAAHQGVGIMVRPMVMNILVAVVIYLWVISTNRAIARADRAEAIAALEHTIAEQEHELAEEKELLERSILLITETHRRIANGEENARVPLDDQNKLWPVAGMLNNLLSRLQFLRRDSYQLERTRMEAERLAAILQQVRMEQRPGRFATTGTPLDVVVVELVNQGLLSPPSR